MFRSEERQEQQAINIDDRSLILSVIISAVIPFPLIIAGFSSIFGKADYLCFCFGTALAILSWVLGFFFGARLKKSENKGSLYLIRCSLWIACGVLILLAEAYLFSFEYQSLSVMLTPAAAILWCRFGFRFGSRQEMISPPVIGIYCTEAAFMYPITASFEEKSSTGTTTILIITAVITVCGVLLFNRRQLNNMSNMGRNKGRLISKATLRFNTKTSLIFSGMILLMFFLAGFGAKWLWYGVKALIRFIIYLLTGNPLGNADEGSTVYKPSIPDELSRIDTSVFWTIVVILAIVLFVVLLRKPIMEFIREFIQNFKKRFGIPAAQKEKIYYTDVYQNIKTRSYRNYTFKKAIQAFKREKDFTKKFRLGYKAFMIRIDEKTEGTAPSDTARIHLEKGKKITDSEKLEEIIKTYCSIRYGGKTAVTEDCLLMTDFLYYLQKK